jgi:hypothetical protein
MFTKACDCPPTEPRKHSNMCCGKEMRSMGVESRQAQPQAPTH